MTEQGKAPAARTERRPGVYGCVFLYGGEVGCALPPEMAADGDQWEWCTRCRILVTHNFSGLCVACRRRLASLPKAAPANSEDAE